MTWPKLTIQIALSGLRQWIRLDLITSDFIRQALVNDMPSDVPPNWTIPFPFRLSLPRDKADSWSSGDAVIWRLEVPGGVFDHRSVTLTGRDERGVRPDIIVNLATMARADSRSLRGKKNRFKINWSLAVRALELMTVLRKTE